MKLGKILHINVNLYRLFPRRSCGEVGLLLIRSDVVGNEASENRNSYCTIMVLRNSQNSRPSGGPIEISRSLDGGHINCLLTTLFLYHIPQLIEAGKVYCAVPPLYKVTKGKDTHYLYSPDELNKYKGYDITRYKGLGEQNPEELWESTMDPDTRELIQLTTDNLQEVIDLYDIIMGNKSKERKQYIMDHIEYFRRAGEDSDDEYVE